eukprot:m.42611 g.42611  ORF g.42611 m.42611 type:complete len:93 (+) comp33373_c0_seq2:228-506(+)
MWENIRHDWNEKGIVGVLEFLEGEAQNLPAGTLRRWLCLLSLNFIQLTANWFSPQLMWPSEERLASFIQTSQWLLFIMVFDLMWTLMAVIQE